MTKEYNATKVYDKNHLHFGGLIYSSDFNTDYRGKDSTDGSSIAARIERDLKIEKGLLKQREGMMKNKINNK